jgi:RimJ/RimL family protein N-acetyltransferase
MRKRDVYIILETPRLAIRWFTEDDVDNLLDLNSDPAVMRYLGGGRPTPREEIRDRIIPFHRAVYDQLDRLGTWAAVRQTRTWWPPSTEVEPTCSMRVAVQPSAAATRCRQRS